MRRTLPVLALVLFTAVPSAAQQLKLAFNDGLVTVDATAVPIRTILTEWAAKGGTKIVGADRISGAPLTLQLIDVPEAKALEVILRSVAGYMAAPRNGGDGASMYDRILVMATSTPPAAAPRPPQNQPAPGMQRFVPPRREPAEESPEDEEDPNPPNPPVFTFPQQGQQFPGASPFPANAPQNGQPTTIVNPATGAPQTITMPPGMQPTPGYPTVPAGSATPGTINAPPPTQPGAVVRPPGSR
jgi:hypothetical protein